MTCAYIFAFEFQRYTVDPAHSTHCQSISAGHLYGFVFILFICLCLFFIFLTAPNTLIHNLCGEAVTWVCVCLERPEEIIRSPGAAVIGGYLIWMLGNEHLSFGSVQVQEVLLTAELSLWSPIQDLKWMPPLK